MWNKVSDGFVPTNIPVLGFSPEWIDFDFNPSGVRGCFIDGDGTWISAKWHDEQDTYINDETTSPVWWTNIPTPGDDSTAEKVEEPQPAPNK
jgi:hypothetical protein